MCAGTRDAQCVYVPYVLSASLEFLRAVARVCGVHVSLHRMWCSAWADVSCGVLVAWLFCGRGAALVAARETQRLPALRGSNQRAAAPATLFRPPGRPCRKESQTFGLIPFRILWIATAVGCQSTHARLRSSSRGGQPALAPTSAPGARDHKRATGPRVYKSSLEPETTSNRVCLEDPSRATGPRVWNRTFCPRPQEATGPRVYKSSSQNWTTRGQPVPQESRSPRLVKKKLDYPSRHAPRKVRTNSTESETSRTTSPRVCESPMTWTHEGNRPTCPLQLSCETETRRTTQVERLTTPLESLKKGNKEELHAIRIPREQ